MKTLLFLSALTGGTLAAFALLSMASKPLPPAPPAYPHPHASSVQGITYRLHP